MNKWMLNAEEHTDPLKAAYTLSDKVWEFSPTRRCGQMCCFRACGFLSSLS